MKKCNSKKIAKFQNVALNKEAKKIVKGGQTEIIIQDMLDV